MPTDENIPTPTPEELQEEQEGLAEVKDEELRSKVVASLGLEDNDANKELIDKVFGREKEHRSKLSKAIGQKIKIRDGKAKPPKPVVPVVPATPLDAEAIRKQAEATTRAALDEEYLEESDFSDVIKAAIRDEVARTGVSARKAAKSEFVQFKVDQEKKAKAVNEAANNGSRKGKQAGQVIDTSKPLNPADYDMTTKEGRDLWNADKRSHAEARKQK